MTMMPNRRSHGMLDPLEILGPLKLLKPLDGKKLESELIALIFY
jgi:hypothetical protein